MGINYQKRLIYLIVFTSILKIIISAFVELGNDEVYYYTYALRPDWSYFDHPPMVGLLIRLTTLNLNWINDVSMRLGAIMGCGISSYFIFCTGKKLHSEKAGWFAALLYNCSVYTGIIAGMFILPDSPQMPFWTVSLYLMSCILFDDDGSLFRRFVSEKSLSNSNDCPVGKESNFAMTNKKILFLLLGLTIGLATLSKVHALFLWAGFGLFILLKKRKLFTNPFLYLGGLITIVCLFLIIYWNIENKFITYTFHSERVTHHTIQFDAFLQEIIGELLYQNPIVYIVLIIGIVFCIKHKEKFSFNKTTWLLCMSIPMLLVFWVVALFNPTLPHWSGPAFIPFMLLTGIYLSEKTNRIVPTSLKFAGSLVIAILIVGTLLANFAPFNLGSKEEKNYGEYCPTLDISGWKDFGKQYAALVEEDLHTGLMRGKTPIIVAKWFPAAHIEMYVARQSHQQVIGLGKLDDLHEFAWLNKERRTLQQGDDAYCIVPSNLPFNVQENYGNMFSAIQKPVIINQMRSGKAVRYFYVYRLKGFKNTVTKDSLLN